MRRETRKTARFPLLSECVGLRLGSTYFKQKFWLGFAKQAISDSFFNLNKSVYVFRPKISLSERMFRIEQRTQNISSSAWKRQNILNYKTANFQIQRGLQSWREVLSVDPGAAPTGKNPPRAVGQLKVAGWPVFLAGQCPGIGIKIHLAPSRQLGDPCAQNSPAGS